MKRPGAEFALRPGTESSGVQPPVICDQYPPTCLSSQGPSGRGRRRQCLLKDCEQWFRPDRPQSRYCSAACRQAARRWRRWQASRRWRASERGRACRRRQGQRYRQRRQRQAERVVPAAAQATAPSSGREGQRPAILGDDFDGQPCQRPGCYSLFLRSARSPGQRFCCAQCRRALRRVLDREARWRQRRRRRSRPVRSRGRPLPGTR
jgi:hypothetical protein